MATWNKLSEVALVTCVFETEIMQADCLSRAHQFLQGALWHMPRRSQFWILPTRWCANHHGASGNLAGESAKLSSFCCAQNPSLSRQKLAIREVNGFKFINLWKTSIRAWNFWRKKKKELENQTRDPGFAGSLAQPRRSNGQNRFRDGGKSSWLWRRGLL